MANERRSKNFRGDVSISDVLKLEGQRYLINGLMVAFRVDVDTASIFRTGVFPVTTWQVSRKSKGFGRAPRAQNPCFFVVNLRTLPSRVLWENSSSKDSLGRYASTHILHQPPKSRFCTPPHHSLYRAQVI
jgi:hypothetical protein